MSKDKTNADKWNNDSKATNKPTPMVVNKYLARIRRLIPVEKEKKYAFRGHADYKWPLESTASRRHEENLLLEEFIEYNCNLVNDAKNADYHQKENKRLADIEILAELRHYNAATALIDFTRDVLIALWFACEPVKGRDKPGKIFIVSTDETEKFVQLTSEDKDKTLKEILRFQARDSDKQLEGDVDKGQRPGMKKPELWYWEPRFEINHRLSSQKGVFIFGKTVIAKKDVNYEEVKIAPKDKTNIRSELRIFFSISEASLFNDLHGFAEINNANHQIPAKTWADYLKKGNEYFQRGELEKAIEQYDKAIELNNKSFAAYRNRGAAKIRLGKYEDALSDCNEAIKLNKQDSVAYLNRGLVKEKLQKYNESLADFDWAIALDPKNANAYSLIGAVKLQLKQHNEALVDLNKAIELDTKNTFFYSLRGAVKLRLKQYNEALVDLNQAIELNSKNTFACSLRGSVKLQLKQYNEALVDLNQAIALDPKNANAYRDRGTAKSNLGWRKKALDDFNRAIELNDKDAASYGNRGTAKSKLGWHQEALADCNQAIKLDPKNAEVYAARGAVKLDIGQPKEALTDLNLAIELNSQNAAIYYIRGRAYTILNYIPKAQADFKKALKLATEQGDKEVIRSAQQALDDLPPSPVS